MESPRHEGEVFHSVVPLITILFALLTGGF